MEATEFAGSISNAVGKADVVGKFEQDRFKAGAGYFLSELIA